ncbi:MAG: hypothetical protein Q7U16_16880 [Agitococcus sp.]|nr:hypothetical protein [Agitococcus sp.]
MVLSADIWCPNCGEEVVSPIDDSPSPTVSISSATPKAATVTSPAKPTVSPKPAASTFVMPRTVNILNDTISWDFAKYSSAVGLFIVLVGLYIAILYLALFPNRTFDMFIVAPYALLILSLFLPLQYKEQRYSYKGSSLEFLHLSSQHEYVSYIATYAKWTLYAVVYFTLNTYFLSKIGPWWMDITFTMVGIVYLSRIVWIEGFERLRLAADREKVLFYLLCFILLFSAFKMAIVPFIVIAFTLISSKYCNYSRLSFSNFPYACVGGSFAGAFAIGYILTEVIAPPFLSLNIIPIMFIIWLIVSMYLTYLLNAIFLSIFSMNTRMQNIINLLLVAMLHIFVAIQSYPMFISSLRI